ncbi:hypothetical protein Tco_0010659 [Tanacetum coccineum]
MCMKEKYLTGNDKKRFEGDIDAMNTILLGIQNDIYNSVDACKTAKAMWTRVRRLMQGTNLRDVTSDDQTDILTTKMMLLAHVITQHYSTPINNHLRTSSNIRNQAYVQDGRVDVQSKNVGNVGTSGQNSRRVVGNQGNTAGNVYVQRTVGNDVEGTSETVEYDINAHDQHLVEMESLMRSVKLEA